MNPPLLRVRDLAVRAMVALEGAGLVETDARRVRLTIEGAAVADAVALKLVG